MELTMRNLTIEQRRKAHKDLKNNPAAISEYRRGLREKMFFRMQKACERAIMLSEYQPRTSKNILSTAMHDKDIMMRQLQNEIIDFADDISNDVGFVLGLAAGIDIEEPPVNYEDRLKRIEILDLRKE